jgi:hypothetical protein
VHEAARETIMKAPRYIIGTHVWAAAVAAATLILAADAASAARYLPRGQGSEYRTQRTLSGNSYESLADGRQPYQNPDRQLYLPD